MLNYHLSICRFIYSIIVLLVISFIPLPLSLPQPCHHVHVPIPVTLTVTLHLHYFHIFNILFFHRCRYFIHVEGFEIFFVRSKGERIRKRRSWRKKKNWTQLRNKIVRAALYFTLQRQIFLLWMYRIDWAVPYCF